MKGVLRREVGPEECPWLDDTLEAGSIVHRFYGATYGVIGSQGVACSFDGGYPFFELPEDAVQWE